MIFVSKLLLFYSRSLTLTMSSALISKWSSDVNALLKSSCFDVHEKDTTRVHNARAFIFSSIEEISSLSSENLNSKKFSEKFNKILDKIDDKIDDYFQGEEKLNVLVDRLERYTERFIKKLKETEDKEVKKEIKKEIKEEKKVDEKIKKVVKKVKEEEKKSSSSVSSSSDKPDDCIVCCEKIRQRAPLSCGHWIHTDCVVKSGKPNCPVCTKKVKLSESNLKKCQAKGKALKKELEEEEEKEVERELKEQGYLTCSDEDCSCHNFSSCSDCSDSESDCPGCSDSESESESEVELLRRQIKELELKLKDQEKCKLPARPTKNKK